MADGDKGLVELVNEMLRQLHVKHEVKKWQDISSDVFVTMFEGLSGENLNDFITNPKTKADEVHNVQLVINTIASDILNTSLSHISGEEVVNGNKMAITNLLEIFSGLLEFILDKISSETSSQKDLSEVEDYEDDPDQVKGELIENILNEELSKGFSESSWRRDDEEELNLHLESSGPWWSDENEDQDKYNNNVNTTAHKKGRVSTEKQVKVKDVPKARPTTGRDVAMALNARSGPREKDVMNDRESSEEVLNSTEDYIKLGRKSSSNVTLSSTGDNTEDLIALGESLQDEPIVNLAKEITRKSVPGPSRHNKYSNVKENAASTAPAEFIYPLTTATDKMMTSTLGSSISGLTVPIALPGGTTEFHDVGIRPSNLDRQTGRERFTDVRRTDVAPITHHLHHYHHYKKEETPAHIASKPYETAGLSRTHPGSAQTNLSLDKPTSSLPVPRASHKSRSFEDLETNVKDTVNFSREATANHAENRTVQDMSGSSQTRRKEVDNMSNSSRYADRPYAASMLQTSDLQSAYRSLQRQGNLSAVERGKFTAEKQDSLKLTDLEVPTKSRGTLSDMGLKQNRKVEFSLASEINDIASRRDTAKDKSCHSRQSRLTDRGTSPIKSLQSSPPKTGPFRKTISTKQAAGKGSPTQQTSPKQPVFHSKANRRMQRLADQLAPPRQLDSNFHKYDHLEHPKTFREYIDKYYGTVERRDMRARPVMSDDEDPSHHSDSAVDYTPEAEKRTDSDQADVSDSDEAFYEPPKLKLPKSVRFDDIIDGKATGAFADMRRSMRSEDKRARAKKGILDKLYSFELKNFQKAAGDSLGALSREAREKEIDYRKKVLSSKPSPSKFKTGRPYTSGSVLLKRSPIRGRPGPKMAKSRRRSASASPSVGRRKTVSTEGDLLPLLLEEFPFLHLTTETLHDLWRKSTRQLSQLSKAELDLRRRKSKAQLQIEEAERRQEILTEIMKKELSHNERMKELKERQQQTQSVKSKVRDKRIQSARGRKYYEDYQIRHRSRMLKKKTKEELLFKKLFQDCLGIQKQRIHEMRKYAKDQRSDRADKQQVELESLENYYRDQFEMLADALAQERSNIEIREKAQSKVLNEMKRQLKEKMESDIQSIQEQMYRDEDDEYYRQLDADRLKHQVNMANYLARV